MIVLVAENLSHVLIFHFKDVNNDLANLQTVLGEKEKEIANLSNELLKIQSEKSEVAQRLQEADNELFKLRAKCKDSDYLLSTKEELIRELQSRLETPVAPAVTEPEIAVQNVKVSSLGARKKPQQRKGKGKAPQEALAESASKQDEAKSKDDALETSLSEEIALLKQKLGDSEAEKRTLNQRVQLLMLEIQSNEGNAEKSKVKFNHNDSIFLWKRAIGETNRKSRQESRN